MEIDTILKIDLINIENGEIYTVNLLLKVDLVLPILVQSFPRLLINRSTSKIPFEQENILGVA